MHRTRNAWIISLTAVSLGTAAAAASGAAFPAGKYHSGNMVIDFGADGRFHVVESGKAIVDGTYQTDGGKVTLTDVSGPEACTGDEASGTYGWRVDGTALTLTKANDPCDVRASDLTRHPLEKQ
ncbi:MAG TPA: hypothetical protein VHE32_10675 [Rhodanobacteraceae bacterium]|jgi:hypothetical protein|nr:hypothetical protein [Rhodanobacteraceae bacterium]